MKRIKSQYTLKIIVLSGCLIFIIITMSYYFIKKPASTLDATGISTTASNRFISLVSNFDVNLTPIFDPTLKNLVDPRNELAFFDFDKGQLVNDQSADVYLFVGCGTSCFNDVIVINGAIAPLHFGFKDEIGYERCVKILQEEESINGVSVIPGDYSCLQTNEGNIIQILAVENVPAWENSKFVFEYLLWHPKAAY